uniref:Uncharacterized protein n=1 Tax=Anguilla anguilla TaxID=7936 RepID=A0A0E9WZT9_ANGAN
MFNCLNFCFKFPNTVVQYPFYCRGVVLKLHNLKLHKPMSGNVFILILITF